MPPNGEPAAAQGTHPLVRRLIEVHGAIELDDAGFIPFCALPGETVLLLCEDPTRMRETPDFAVVLPELARACGKSFRIGVADSATVRLHHARFGVRTLPALVFLREGALLGTIEGLRDWGELVRLARDLLTGPAQPASARVIPISAGSAPACS
jgi:hydrogenase-1 operon protein HyaE